MKAREERHVNWLRERCGVQRVRPGQVRLMERLYSLWMSMPHASRDRDCFIPASVAKGDSALYRDIIKSTANRLGYSSKVEGKCDLIVGWLSEFSDYYIDYLADELRRIRRARAQDNAKADEMVTLLRPGLDKGNYRQTPNSCRYYAEVQSMPRDWKRRVYSGCFDADMQCCHPNLFNRWIVGDRPKHAAFVQMIEAPEEFLERIVRSGAMTPKVAARAEPDRDKAKRMRSRLFNPPKGGNLKPIGVQWYDDLAKWIGELLNDAGVWDAHMYFTALEQELIELAAQSVGEERVMVNMHDGLILEPEEEWEPEEIARILTEATGMKWKCERF